MADNYLEKHYEDYEAREEAWLRKRRHIPDVKRRHLERPEDDAL